MVQDNENEVKHAPLPWRIFNRCFIVGNDGDVVASTQTHPYNKTMEADLALIVTAVNAHAALEARVAALEATAETVLAILDSRDADAVWESNLRKLLRDTLKGGRP